MSLLNPLFPVGLTLIALVVCVGLGRLPSAKVQAGRFGSIDGLRGFLALFVFLHHSSIWFFYIKTGRWELPSSNLFVHLGQTSVGFFFMITAFLFYDKVLASRGLGMDWFKFFVGRVLRLTPLYLVSITLVLLIVCAESHWILNEPFLKFLKSATHWYAFTIFDQPSVNTVVVWRINSGVVWSLSYEWFFYLCLPLLAVFSCIRVKWLYVLISVVTITFASAAGYLLICAVIFSGGIFAAWAVRWQAFSRFALTPIANVVVLASLFLLVEIYPTAYGYPQILLIAIAFSLIAAGTDLFGLFSLKAAHTLGEMAYSIYLLHGILLFITLKYVIGYQRIQEVSAVAYWAMIYGLVPVLLVAATVSFRTIELPSMRLIPMTIAWLKALRSRLAISREDPSADRSVG